MISLQEMANLARALLDADDGVAQAELGLKDAKARVQLLREETIPSAMHELGLEELKLDTGQKLTVRQEVYASIPSDKRVEAFDWLNDNGYGGLIRTDVVSIFSKGDRDRAVTLAKDLLAQGYQSEVSESVHPQTLKAFLREQIALGTSVPLELFGARPVWQAKIK